MALNARKVKNNSGPKAPLIDEGAYPARLQGVVDCGLQPQQYNKEAKAPANEIWTTYELSDEFIPDEDGNPNEEKPRWFSEFVALYNLDSDKARSTKRYYALDPNEEEEGDWAELIGRPVLVTIVTKGEYNNIGGTSTMRPKEAAKLPKLVNTPRVFSMDDPDVEVFLSLPNFVQDKIKNGLEFEGSKLDELLQAHKGGGKSTKGESEKNVSESKTKSRGKTDDIENTDSGDINNATQGDDGDDW